LEKKGRAKDAKRQIEMVSVDKTEGFWYIGDKDKEC